MYKTISAVLITLVGFMCACQSGTGQSNFEDLSDRVISIITDDLEGQAPLAVEFYLYVQGDDRDIGRTSPVDSFEFQLDNSMDWQQILPSYTHEYTEPGVYILSARATWWDGEIVYSTPRQITVH